ncbi:MAG: hypothetical protein WD557_04705 [Dehalococcoidia bacterium]
MARWWPFARERVRVDLEPAQLVIIHFLLRYKAAPEGKLHEEVLATNGLDRGAFLLSLGDLASKGVVDPRFQPDDGETWFVLTKLGKRLRGKIPRESRSGLAIYL